MECLKCNKETNSLSEKDDIMVCDDCLEPKKSPPEPSVDKENVIYEIDVKGTSYPLEKVIELGERAGNTFNTIAFFSLVNSLLIFFKADIVFPVGLAVTQISDGIALVIKEGWPSNIVTTIIISCFYVFNIIVSLIFFYFNKKTSQLNFKWFVIGIVLYILDGLICLALKDYITFGFHCFMLFFLYGAMQFIKPAIKAKQHSSLMKKKTVVEQI
jgi:hypothetical protein